MSEFEFLKKYITNENNPNLSKYKHLFFNVDEKEITRAEKRMDLKFPKELRDFYLEIGYGFLCNHDKKGFNRIMDPLSVADFRLGEGIYEYDPDREMYDNMNSLVFFEISEGTYLTIRLNEVTLEGKCPIYYFDKLIARSLEEFIKKMDEKTDYYL
jgi:antitoxin YxxD